MKQYDLVVIGGGSGGVRAARIAAGHGAKVAICEEYRYGGTCVIRGCVPKKLMVYAAHFAEDFEDSRTYGWDTRVNGFDWPTLITNKDQEIDRLNGIYEKLLTNAGVEMFHGSASLVDAHTVSINDQSLRADKILIATGGTPFLPPIPGVELAITSNEVFHLEEQPNTAIVIGGGYIAVEFAGIFNGLGTDTTLVYRGPQILRGFDDAVRTHLADEITKKGINLRLNEHVERIELVDDGRKLVTYANGDRIAVDCVLFATGRSPNTANLNLVSAGVELGTSGQILVDEHSKTNVDSIYAVGDVTDRIALTPVATMEGHAFADTVFGDKPRLADHNLVPSAVFSQPSVATVGYTEQDARAEFEHVDTYTSSFRSLKHTLTDNTERVLMKLVVDAASDKVIGAHMVGPEAAEIMQGIAIAIKAGARKADFDATVGIHPSMAEEFCTMRTKDAD
ncbi:glutathione-disulfide reductase [Arenicella chitinivorans]|uniref:Glutathione reductase n=1 Tax=Arenicella chitinivorans TaxID=1329800 RepID=A0A918VMT8_9GAMM|nr:glutathione-disulfide reductase [Arenicella chitinivorans]GHA10059.1 glutathione-disulfide reductase [Arenicella chitinivorans]